MSIRPTNNFNTLILLTPYQLSAPMRYKLMMLIENGESIVNPYSDLDRDGLSAKGRARKERERDERAFRQAMAELQERQERFERELDLREQACVEALRENEEQTRAVREELRKVQERAYKIDLPDGTTARVYRDGDKVRDETGLEVSRDVVRAEDLGSAHSTWEDYTRRTERIDELQAKHAEIVRYQQKLRETDERHNSGRLSADEIDAADRQLNETMPEDVRRHHVELSEPKSRSGPDRSAPKEGARLGVPFAQATSATGAGLAISEEDFMATQPLAPASVRAPGS